MSKNKGKKVTYKAKCTECDYEGAERTREKQANEDAIAHNIKTKHQVEVLTIQSS